MMALKCRSFGLNRIIKTMMHTTEQTVDVYGRKINYVQSGEGENTLLLMPGALGSAWTDFRPQIQQLPKLLPHYTIIAWDPPGCGKSTTKEQCFEGFLFQSDAYCAIDLMQAIKRNSFSILGWNTGGTTALMMAGRFPQFVDKLVVWGSSAFLTDQDLKKLNDYRGVDSVKRRYNIGNQLKSFYGEEQFSKMWPSYMNAIEKNLKEKKGNICKTEVDCIQAPTLILHGAKDPIIPLDRVQFLLRHIKNSKYHEFPDAKHDIHLNQSHAFNKHVAKFLLEKPYHT